jgi:hypothetical protein
MKKTIVFALLFLAALPSFAQTTSKAVYVEAGGIGLPYSISFDTRFKKGTNTGIGGRIGFGGFIIEDEKMLTVPVQVNWLFGKEKNYFELGIGATYVHYQGWGYYEDYRCDATGCYPTGKYYAGDFVLPISNVNSVMGTISFGYRRVPTGSGFTWKAGITPLFNDNGFWPLFGGIGVGYKF